VKVDRSTATWSMFGLVVFVARWVGDKADVLGFEALRLKLFKALPFK
jgi:hypothetical protein